MSRLKFQQLKKLKLHEFLRKERDNIIKERQSVTGSNETDDMTSIGRPSTAATTNLAQ